MVQNTRTTATAFAPATVANVAVGFDILGFALETVGDRVTVTKTPNIRKVEIESITGPDGVPVNLPVNPSANCATVGMMHLLEEARAPFGLKVKITKGIPIGSGIGGSAASAVAGVMAANALLPSPLDTTGIFTYALDGEAVASGSKHGDNVGPSLFGGIVLVRSIEPPLTVQIPVPRALYAVVVLPPIRVETKSARQMLRPEIPLKLHVEQSARLATFLSGCFRNDLSLIGGALEDVIIEPQRAKLIRGFPEAKAAALHAGALGCSISGSGPAVFALVHDERVRNVSQAMVRAFEAAGVKQCRVLESVVSTVGAKVEG
jgi:homoserine kinase